ncbi:hypothetical protein ACU79H_004288, partial [Vibrio fluvialis]
RCGGFALSFCPGLTQLSQKEQRQETHFVIQRFAQYSKCSCSPKGLRRTGYFADLQKLPFRELFCIKSERVKSALKSPSNRHKLSEVFSGA